MAHGFPSEGILGSPDESWGLSREMTHSVLHQPLCSANSLVAMTQILMGICHTWVSLVGWEAVSEYCLSKSYRWAFLQPQTKHCIFPSRRVAITEVQDLLVADIYMRIYGCNKLCFRVSLFGIILQYLFSMFFYRLLFKGPGRCWCYLHCIKSLDIKLSKKGDFGQCNVIYLLKPFYNNLAV